MLRPLLRTAMDIAVPARCAGCGSAVATGGELLCVTCAEALRAARPHCAVPGPPGLDAAVAAAPFEGVARSLVHELKFRRRLGVAPVAASLMGAALGGHLADVEAVVPVPADPVRWVWRGYDPAEELALALAEDAGLPLIHCLRRGHGPRQVGRARAERLSRPPRVRSRAHCRRTVLLVDDVWTTGATLSACARALREGGCIRVVSVCMARAVPLSPRLRRPTIPVNPTEGGAAHEDRRTRQERRGDR